MADDEILDEEEEDEYNIVAIIIAVVLLLAIIGGVVWYFFLRTPPEEETNPALQLPKWEAPVDAPVDEVFTMLPKMILNPADSNGRYYLVVKVDVAWNNGMPDDLGGKPWLLEKAKNLIIDVFSSYTISELQTPKFKEEARLELKYELNKMLGWEGWNDQEPTPEEMAEMDPESLPPIKEVYLVEFILQ